MNSIANAVLLIHGGAGVTAGHDYSAPAAMMKTILTDGGLSLRAGAAALELVVDMVAMMEESGLFIAGKGSDANQAGEVELDASVMTGHNRAAGAIAAARNVVNPVRLAAALMDKTPHVMLAGPGAELFADEIDSPRVTDPKKYYRAASDITGSTQGTDRSEPATHGTVGAVALDRSGRLAAATSTGGLLNKRHGRVGDTPLIGAGTWADDLVAVSATGHGEYFIRVAAAHDVAARMAYQSVDVEVAALAVINSIGDLGGDGGLIAVDKSGRIAMPFNSRGMKRGWVGLDSEPVVEIY